MIASLYAASFTVMLSFLIYIPWNYSALSGETGDILLRVRAVTYQPRERSSITPIGGNVAVEHINSPEIDLTYFFTPYIAIESLLGLVNPDIGVQNTSIGDKDIGDVWVAAPTAILQLHPLGNQRISPYIGAGLTYAFFFSPDSKNVNSINYRNAPGYVLQVGVDYNINKRWSINLDMKKVFLGTHITANTAIGAVNSSVDFDPWVMGIGVGYRF